MLSQIKEITIMNLLNLPSRLGSSSVIIVGIAGVVAVLDGAISAACFLKRLCKSCRHRQQAHAVPRRRAGHRFRRTTRPPQTEQLYASARE